MIFAADVNILIAVMHLCKQRLLHRHHLLFVHPLPIEVSLLDKLLTSKSPNARLLELVDHLLKLMLSVVRRLLKLLLLHLLLSLEQLISIDGCNVVGEIRGL